MKAILAIDPGTYCGWALRFDDGSYLSGVWNLTGGRFEGGGMRFVHLRKNLEATRVAADIKQVAFEEVRRHLGTDAAHVYGGIVATLTSWCEEHQIPYTGIPVQTVKKHATGKGNANKAAMMLAAEAKWRGYKFEDDNEADARFIAEVAA